MNEFMRNYKVLTNIAKMIENDTNSFLEDDDKEALSSDLTIEYKGVKVNIPLDFACINNAVQDSLADIQNEYASYIDVGDVDDDIEFEEIEPMYTGGNIWCFWGKLTNGLYFQASDFMDSFRVLTADPRGNDDAWYEEWYGKYLVCDFNDDKVAPIFIKIYKWLKANNPKCGMDFDSEIAERMNK